MPVSQALPGDGEASRPALIYGVDVGSRRLAIADPRQPHYEIFKLKAMRSGHKVDQTFDIPLMGDWLADTVPRGALIVLEKPFKGSVAGNIGTAVRLSQVAGAVIAKHRGRCIQIVPGTWKKAVIGNGGADKPAIQDWVRHNYPAIAAACEEDQDLYDAACMGLYGQLLTTGQMEVSSQVLGSIRS